jgi:MbtH protein
MTIVEKVHERERTMSNIFDAEDVTFQVVVNAEEQYSIWPAEREIPSGWRAIGKSGTKKECLAHIEEVWTDLRPASLRAKPAAEA